MLIEWWCYIAVTDFNFGTLIRTDSADEYTQYNTTFGELSFPLLGCLYAIQSSLWSSHSPPFISTVTRLQFYVYEIARNRRGLNDWVFEKAQKEAAEAAAKKKAAKK